MEVTSWLTETKAADLMVRDVVTFPATATLADVAAVLLKSQVSGAPIVDDSGICIGVVSVSDLVGADDKVNERAEAAMSGGIWETGLLLPTAIYADKLESIRDDLAPTSEHLVTEFMTTDLVSVQEDATLRDVVFDLVEAHIHRVIVVDERQRLRGVISTTDVLAALLRAA